MARTTRRPTTRQRELIEDHLDRNPYAADRQRLIGLVEGRPLQKAQPRKLTKTPTMAELRKATEISGLNVSRPDKGMHEDVRNGFVPDKLEATLRQITLEDRDRLPMLEKISFPAGDGVTAVKNAFAAKTSGGQIAIFFDTLGRKAMLRPNFEHFSIATFDPVTGKFIVRVRDAFFVRTANGELVFDHVAHLTKH